jgi:hypothetical protein
MSGSRSRSGNCSRRLAKIASMLKILSGLFLAFSGFSVGLMMQVGPHDAATNFCNWLSFWQTCPQSLPTWFDKWGWILPAFLVFMGLIFLPWPLITHLPPQFRRAKSNWELQWPIQRKKGWPYNADLAARVFHVRSYAYFDHLESENQFRIVLFFLNATTEEIAIESVAGHLSGFTEYSPIGWLDAHKPPNAPPFGEIEVNIQQHLPSATVHNILEQIKSGNSLSLEFHLQIRARALRTGEVLELRPWDGVTCAKPEHPVITGRLLVVRKETFTGSGSSKVGK